mmetsp:Transcript_45221/g.104853  ORF Transcript_45221/g.104853 Transcript_45221/m.104853 type:complete len:297 (+) Transcript_45221:169-1059(+)
MVPSAWALRIRWPAALVSTLAAGNLWTRGTHTTCFAEQLLAALHWAARTRLLLRWASHLLQALSQLVHTSAGKGHESTTAVCGRHARPHSGMPYHLQLAVHIRHSWLAVELAVNQKWEESTAQLHLASTIATRLWCGAPGRFGKLTAWAPADQRKPLVCIVQLMDSQNSLAPEEVMTETERPKEWALASSCGSALRVVELAASGPWPAEGRLTALSLQSWAAPPSAAGLAALPRSCPAEPPANLHLTSQPRRRVVPYGPKQSRHPWHKRANLRELPVHVRAPSLLRIPAQDVCTMV